MVILEYVDTAQWRAYFGVPLHFGVSLGTHLRSLQHSVMGQDAINWALI